MNLSLNNKFKKHSPKSLEIREFVVISSITVNQIFKKVVSNNIKHYSFNALINSLSAIVEAGGDAKELSKMAKECRKEIDKEIKFIKD